MKWRSRFWAATGLTFAFGSLFLLWTYVAPRIAAPRAEDPLTSVSVGEKRAGGNKYGLVNRRGRMVSPPVWKWASDSRDGLAECLDDSQRHRLDGRGEVVSSSDRGSSFDFEGEEAETRIVHQARLDSEGWTLVFHFSDGRFGWKDRSDGEATPGRWDGARPFDQDGWAAVCKSFKWGWIDRSGKPVLPFAWDKADSFDEHGWAAVQKGSVWGWIDRKGSQVLPFHWTDASDFNSFGLAAVYEHCLWGWIDRRGREVVPCRWDERRDFDGFGWAPVRERDKWGCIDRTGVVTLPVEWDHLSAFDEWNRAVAHRDGQIVLVDRAGRRCLSGAGSIDHTALGYRATWGGHPWFEDGSVRRLLDAAGLTDHLPFEGLVVLYDENLRPTWRSDLYVVDWTLPWLSGGFALLATLCGWRWRRTTLRRK